MILYPKHDVFSLLGTGPRPDSHFFCPEFNSGFFVDPKHIPMYFTLCKYYYLILTRIRWLISLPNCIKSEARFCERCGTLLVVKAVEDRERPCCPACGFVAYLDPKVAAGVIVTLDGGVVLLKRNIDPGFGKWVFPGGYVDAGEPTDVAAVRETREEVGLEVEIGELLGVLSYEGERVVLIVYTGRVVGGKLEGNFESQAVATFAPRDIPWNDLAFDTTREALQIWVAQYGEMYAKERLLC